MCKSKQGSVGKDRQRLPHRAKRGHRSERGHRRRRVSETLHRPQRHAHSLALLDSVVDNRLEV